MVKTNTDLGRSHGHGGHGVHAAETASVELPGRPAQRSRFWRHFIEMLLAMLPGMFLAAFLVVVGTGTETWEAALVRYPTLCLTAMVVGMTLPMGAWMLIRGMGRRNAAEMAIAMAFPVIPFLCLVWFGVTPGAWCGGYCAASVVAMLALMTYRRDVYSMPM